MKITNQFKYTFLAALFVLCCSFMVFQKPALSIVFIGDSITYGGGIEGRTPPVHAAQILRDKYGYDVAFSNQGYSGFTTANFLPSGLSYQKLKAAASTLMTNRPGSLLVFSIMLGTNDSAEQGPLGSPVSPVQYRENLTLLIDSLSAVFPKARFCINHPLWYSATTQNQGARYLQAGLDRLISYIPEIHEVVTKCSKKRSHWVYEGDHKAFAYFKQNHETAFYPETGPKGQFFLHPNENGAEVLAGFWASRLDQVLR